MNGKTFLNRLILLLAVLLAGTLAAWGLLMIILLIQSSFDIHLVAQLSAKLMEDTGMLRITQLIQSLCLFVLPPFVLTHLYKERPGTFLRFKTPDARYVLMAIFSLLVAMPFINLLVTWNEGLRFPDCLNHVEQWMRTSESAATDVTNKMLSGSSWTDLMVNLFIVAMVAGFGEELFFRGLVQRLLSDALNNRLDSGNYPKWVMHTSIWVTAFIFSAIHLQFFGFFPRLLLGAWFGYLLWWTGSIWVPIAAHFTNNALSTFFTFGQNNGWFTSSPDQFGVDDTLWATLISLLLFGCCVFYFIKGPSEKLNKN